MDLLCRVQSVLLIFGLCIYSGLINSQENNQVTPKTAQNMSSCGCNKTPSRFGQSMSIQALHQGMVKIPKGSFMMGEDTLQAKNNEFPKHRVQIKSFWLDEATVTNEQFQQFIKTTGYITIAEKKPDWEELKNQLPENTPKPDDSKLVPASLVFTQPDQPVSLNDYSQWWSWTLAAQ